MGPFCPEKMPDTGFCFEGYAGDPEMVTGSVIRPGFSSTRCWRSSALLETASFSDGDLVAGY